VTRELRPIGSRSDVLGQPGVQTLFEVQRVTDDGEIESEAEAHVRTLFECMAPSYWRVGALRSLGIDANEYCETTWGRQTIQFIGELGR
jgi:hypothetical protein